MIRQQDPVGARPTTLEERRLFLQLPLEERRRQLAQQADRAIEPYEQKSSTQERLEWQGGDIVEY